MGKASSSKKIKRVQQAGATRTPGQRRELGYPALIAVIMLAGLVLTAFAVLHRRDVEQVRPTEEDHWVAPYGTYVCNEFIGNLETIQPDAPADLHADGLIHIHPTGPENAGENAVFGLYMTSAGISIDQAGTLTLPDGSTYADGADCDGEPGRVALYQWPPQSNEDTEPRIITSNIAGTRFTEDEQIFVLAFAPRGAEVPLPPSVSNLDDPDGTEPTVENAEEFTPSTVAPGDDEHSGEDTGGEQPTTTASPTTEAEGETTTTAGG